MSARNTTFQGRTSPKLSGAQHPPQSRPGRTAAASGRGQANHLRRRQAHETDLATVGHFDPRPQRSLNRARNGAPVDFLERDGCEVLGHPCKLPVPLKRRGAQNPLGQLFVRLLDLQDHRRDRDIELRHPFHSARASTGACYDEELVHQAKSTGAPRPSGSRASTAGSWCGQTTYRSMTRLARRPQQRPSCPATLLQCAQTSFQAPWSTSCGQSAGYWDTAPLIRRLVKLFMHKFARRSLLVGGDRFTALQREKR